MNFEQPKHFPAPLQPYQWRVYTYIDDTSLLVAILDINPFLWGERADLDNNNNNISNNNNNNNNNSKSTNTGVSFSTYLEHILVFLNAYMMLQQQNLLAVIASSPITRYSSIIKQIYIYRAPFPKPQYCC